MGHVVCHGQRAPGCQSADHHAEGSEDTGSVLGQAGTNPPPGSWIRGADFYRINLAQLSGTAARARLLGVEEDLCLDIVIAVAIQVGLDVA